MNILLMGALVNFDVWQETAERRYIAGTWALYLLGAFAKEHVYIFPAIALAVAYFRRRDSKIDFRLALIHCALMFAFVFALWAYRAAIIADPRNPELKPVHLKKKPWLYLAYPFYKHVLAAEYWLPGLSVCLMILGSGLLILRRSRHAVMLRRPYVVLGVVMMCALFIAAYCALTYGSIFDAIWYLFDPANGASRAWQLLHMMSTIYAFWLLWKYRKTQPTALAFTFLVLSYVPVTTYLGWHYTVAAWFVRCAYWALVAKLVWREVSPLLLPRVRPWLRRIYPALELPEAARAKSSPA